MEKSAYRICKFRSFRQAISVQTGRRFRWKPTGRFGPKRHPAVWPENPGNEAFFHEAGDKPAVEAAFARAERIVRRKTVINRITANSMEPRGCLAQYDPDDDRYTIRCTVQSVHGPRAMLADISEVPVDDNQSVHDGEILARIDPRDYQTALDQARANVTGAQASIDTLSRQIAQP
jgi:hypothetical protein